MDGMFSSASAPDIVGPNELGTNRQSAAAADLPASNQENS